MDPSPVQPLDYAEAQSSNRPAVASLIFGLLLFIPFIPGVGPVVVPGIGPGVLNEVPVRILIYS